jgi:hypothetical protein
VFDTEESTAGGMFGIRSPPGEGALLWPRRLADAFLRCRQPEQVVRLLGVIGVAPDDREWDAAGFVEYAGIAAAFDARDANVKWLLALNV